MSYAVIHVRDENSLHLYHIKPLSKGGDNNISNLRLLCENCHSRVHGGRNFSGVLDQTETAFSKRVANIRYAIDNDKDIQFGYKKSSDTSFNTRTGTSEELVSMAHQRNYTNLRSGT